MPTLNWIGKQAVAAHHKDVPFRLLEAVPTLAAGDAESGNLIVQGDNLLALKALLPRYAGQVKCIYIDPPYNTGNEGWVYNDNVNSPEIRRWLGETVGKEGETLDRHDRWLCMMYPRLMLLKQFLSNDGVIFVNIGTDELANLGLLMDEIFGASNRIAVAAWETSYTANQTAKHISETTDFIYIYAKNFDKAAIGKWDRTVEQLEKFKNPDNDPRGPWKAENLSAGKFYSAGQFQITGPTGQKFLPPPGRYWRCNEAQFFEWLKDGRITYGINGTGRPMLKKYRNELIQGLTPTTWWKHEEFATAKDGSIELKAILDGQSVFSTPKPTRLIQRILQIATNKDDLVLDSFAGSGTTAHAVLKQNAEDGGNRRFILVEMDNTIAQTVTTERVKRVSQGYTSAKGKAVDGLGSGFQFYQLSAEPLFTADGKVRPDVTFQQLAEFVWFTETGTGLTSCSSPDKGRLGGVSSFTTPLLGIFQNRAIFMLYNGILKDKTDLGGNVLNAKTLHLLQTLLPEKDMPCVVFGARSRLDKATLTKLNITFHQLPYELAAKTWF